jgi:hypothetical protein
MVNDGLDNLKKLHEIVTKMESQKEVLEMEDSIPYHDELTDKINSLIHDGLKNLSHEQNDRVKLKNYEILFTSIIGVFESVRQIV